MEKIIIFNWKMNPASRAEAEVIAEGAEELKQNSKRSEVIVCPPFVWLSDLLNKYKTELKFGVQDIFWESMGAYTGEISPLMLEDLGVEYAIVGHSERRRIMGETDEMINKKLLAGLKSGLKMILCVGEDLNTRQKGREELEKFIKNQLDSGLSGVAQDLIIAYEPIWAIGTGIPATPGDALTVIKFIKEVIAAKNLKNTKVLYGGSVDAKNIESFINYPEIDGVLVGGASLNPKQFINLI